MWIKQVKKQNSKKGKTFYQYQLTETYRVGGVVKHKPVLYLGDNVLLRDKSNRQLLGKLLENKLRNTLELSDDMSGLPDGIAVLAEEYYEKYLQKAGNQACATEAIRPEDHRRVHRGRPNIDSGIQLPRNRSGVDVSKNA